MSNRDVILIVLGVLLGIVANIVPAGIYWVVRH